MDSYRGWAMGVREVAMDAVATKMMVLTGEIAPMQQAVLRRANAKGMSGAVVIELVDEYKKRLAQLADCCVEQFEWEIKHAVGFRRGRGEQWRGIMRDSLNALSNTCLAGYLDATRNIVVLSSPNVTAEFRARLGLEVQEVQLSATSLLQKKAEEVNSSTVKGGLGLLKKGALAGGSAVAGYLWHKYFG